MVKQIIKEAFVTILLCAALCLVLAIVFYEYIPINKVVPEPVQYSMPNELSEVKEELSHSIDQYDEKEPILTYTIDEDDLYGYKQTRTYNAGKADPFEVYSDEPETADTNTEDTPVKSEENKQNSESTTTHTKKTTSSGTLFDDGSTK